jgi:hypothetical protein
MAVWNLRARIWVACRGVTAVDSDPCQLAVRVSRLDEPAIR